MLGPFLTIGEIVVVSWTVPLKLLVPVIVIVKIADAPFFIV